jgi:hypothetical protein
MPLASLRLELGQWATEQPCCASSSISSALEVHRVHRDQRRAQQPQAAQAFNRAHPETLQAVVDFLRGFMQMEMNRQLDLFGEGQHAGKAPVADGVRRMRGEAERQQRFIQQLVANRQPLGQIVVRVGCIVARKIDRDQADCGADSRSQHGVRCRCGKEVHVVETGDAAAQHFGAGKQGPSWTNCAETCCASAGQT